VKKVFYIFIVSLICCHSILGIEPGDLLKKKYPLTLQKTTTKYIGICHDRSVFARYNPLTLFFDGSMLVYQKAISEQFSAQCEYTPSCSDFSKKLIQRFGMLKGIFLSADRLMRCNGHALDENYPFRLNTSSGKIADATIYYQWGNIR